MTSTYKENCTQVDIDTVVRIKAGDKDYVKATGNRITVLDNTNKLIDEFSAQRVMPSNSNTRTILQSSLLKYVDTTIKGHNLLVMSLGTTNSGKEYLIPGSKSETGIATMFLESLFASLDLAVNAKSSKKQSLSYSVRFQFVELVDEKVTDLMSTNKYTALDVRDDPWEGAGVLAKWTTVKNFAAARTEVQNGFKNHSNSMNELGDMSGRASCILIVEVTQKFIGNEGISSTITSRVVFCQLPGLEVLKNNQGEMRIKQQHASIRGLVAFCAIIKHLAENRDNAPLYESSKLTHMLKDYLGGNAFAVAILSVASSDPEGSVKTLKFIRALNEVPQFPIFNNGESIGLLHKFRVDKVAEIPISSQPINSLESERMILQSNLSKIRSEDDYRRILQKYTDLKNKYNNTLKAKSDVQVELIKCEQQKLQISKNIIELQIQNTRLMEELQGKEYQMGRKILKAESSMIEKQVANSKYAERISSLEEQLTKAIDTKRDLEVEFIALKKNYITQQKDLQQLRRQNEKLGLDVINLNNQNKSKELQAQQNVMRGSKADDYFKVQIEQLQKDKAQLEQNQKFLKSEVDRYRDQVVKYELSLRDNADLKSSKSSRSGGNDYKQLELENQKIELNNRVKLLNRRIDELQQTNNQLNEDITELKDQNKQLADLESENTVAYRTKLEKIAQNDTSMAIGELKQSFNNVQKRNKQKLQDMHKKLLEQKGQARSLAAYSRELKQLAIEYAPKGIQLPSILTQARPELEASISGDPSEVEKLRTKNRKLQQELSIMKSISRQGSVLSNERLAQEINFLRTSNAKDNGQSQKLRGQKNQLQQENRKLMSMLKDGKKMDSALLQKQNQDLKRQISTLRNGKESISPNSGDQKLQYYQKHLKKLEKERSQLLVRCTVAEQQLRTLQEHYARKK